MTSRRIAASALLVALFGVLGAGEALAFKRNQPLTPPGLSQTQVDRPEQAATPDTGRQNSTQF